MLMLLLAPCELEIDFGLCDCSYDNGRFYGRSSSLNLLGRCDSYDLVIVIAAGSTLHQLHALVIQFAINFRI